MTYYNDLMNKANTVADGIVTFTNSSSHHDACGSIMCEISNDDETYVQLFAFETKEDMKLEGFTEKFYIAVVKEGDIIYDLDLMTNNVDAAIAYAVQQAKDLQDEQDEKDYVEMCDKGFEFDGMWIEDRLVSPCGRFDLTEEESIALYGVR